MTSTDATLAALARGDLAGVRHLHLPCGLTELPAEVTALGDSLEILDLSGNALSALPDDFGRLRHLRVLFASGNRFAQLPPVLGDCPALSQVMFRGNGLNDVPAESLPARLRWLALTDNRVTTLPDALGARPALQKLMLAGNELSALPDSLADAGSLELVRLSANRFESYPSWLPALPRLAWLSWAGNPFEPPLTTWPVTDISWAHCELGGPLGEGASGHVHDARWRQPGGASTDVALKLFKSAMTSDGLPEREMSACLASGSHPHLVSALGRIVDHPQGKQALVMPRVPTHWHSLAGPPSLESCSRDVYDPALMVSPAVAVGLVVAVASAVAHLHGRGLSHGDVYAHNVLWDGDRTAWRDNAALGDFGAASNVPAGADRERLQRLEVRAVGVLLGELLDRCDPRESTPVALRSVRDACLQPDVRSRPSMTEVAAALQALQTLARD